MGKRIDAEAVEAPMDEEFLADLRKENLAAGQSLASVLNNPKPKEEFWFFWPTVETVVEPTVEPLSPEEYPEVSEEFLRASSERKRLTFLSVLVGTGEPE